MSNSGRVEINSSVTDSLRSVHGEIYVIFYGRIRIPGISGNFGACANSVYQALLSAHEREPGFEASKANDQSGLDSFKLLQSTTASHGRTLVQASLFDCWS